jgi:hypothetical protein
VRRQGLAARARENGELVVGDGAREDTGACLVDRGCGGEANGAEKGARGGVECWSGAWPWRALVRAHAVIGMALGSSGHDTCQHCGASLRLWRVLACAGEQGEANGHGGQG